MYPKSATDDAKVMSAKLSVFVFLDFFANGKKIMSMRCVLRERRISNAQQQCSSLCNLFLVANLQPPRSLLKPATPDGTITKSVGFISPIYLVGGSLKVFLKGSQKLKCDWVNHVSGIFKWSDLFLLVMAGR